MPEFVPVSKARQRYTFGRAHDMVEMPDMIEVQRNSYHWFYQDDVAPDKRKSQGLQELLEEVFPIESYDGQFALEFADLIYKGGNVFEITIYAGKQFAAFYKRYDKCTKLNRCRFE